MKRTYLYVLLAAAMAQAATAQVKDVARMQSAARQALAAVRGVDAEAAVAAGAEMRELRALDHCSVMGAADGRAGFAVVTTDGRQVLGVSTAPSSQGQNPGFEWWLRAVDEALGNEALRETSASSNRPDPKKYPVSVAPMLTTHWGQMDPYNRKCPYDTLKQERTVVGCMATSMAQVLNYYQTPERGEGQRTIYYPYQDSINGQAVTVDFGAATYRWDLLEGMANFQEQPFTDEQADAISTLMFHLGVAANMQYGTKDAIGSATSAAAAAEGLRTYLRQPETRVVYRDNYSDAEWLDMVYGELSTGHPLMYGGQAFSGGHSFVLNGYDRNGWVYVNWGWNGDDEGYFDINLLNPGGTSFADRQDMIIGINPTAYAPLLVQVTTEKAGTLADQLKQHTLMPHCSLVVRGPLNDADFQALRTAVINGGVSLLSLSQAVFESLPEKALYGCTELTTLDLPAGLKHIGDGALGDLRYLTNLALTPADDADFVVDGPIIYNKEKTEIICVLSTASGELVVAPTVKAIHPYAFSGCVLLERIELPASVSSLGAETFRDCYWLEELKVRSKDVITLQGYDVFEGIDKSVCTLYVPRGLSGKYKKRAQWKEFLSMEEFGTSITATNVVRRQGEPNPDFQYVVSGDPVDGTPLLYSDATQDSPAGVYVIFVEAGTITSPDVDYVNGKLIVEPDTEGIDGHELSTSTSQSAALYDLQGRGLRTAGHGTPSLLLERQADGQVRKRLVGGAASRTQHTR